MSTRISLLAQPMEEALRTCFPLSHLSEVEKETALACIMRGIAEFNSQVPGWYLNILPTSKNPKPLNMADRYRTILQLALDGFDHEVITKFLLRHNHRTLPRFGYALPEGASGALATLYDQMWLMAARMIHERIRTRLMQDYAFRKRFKQDVRMAA